MMKVKGWPEVAVLPIHFEDRSGSEFERLCFAYLLRVFDWKTIDWYGQLGGDSGRDIWGPSPERAKNYSKLTRSGAPGLAPQC